MRNRILGAIAILWGGGLLVFQLIGSNQPQGRGAYGAGQSGGLIFGAALLAVGMYCFVKSLSSKSTE